MQWVVGMASTSLWRWLLRLLRQLIKSNSHPEGTIRAGNFKAAFSIILISQLFWDSEPQAELMLVFVAPSPTQRP